MLEGILDVLRFCGNDATAEAVQEARELFYNGRTDLPTIGARSDAGIRGFRHPTWSSFLTQRATRSFFDGPTYTVPNSSTFHGTDFCRPAFHTTNGPNRG